MANNCKRPDLSTFLIHLTNGDSEREAFDNLKSIIKSKTLLKSKYKISGQHTVCFTETPI